MAFKWDVDGRLMDFGWEVGRALMGLDGPDKGDGRAR